MNVTLARAWCARWERQQELYAGDRTERFEAVLDVVEAVCGRPQVVVDLGSGPGSLAVHAADRFPSAVVVAIDHDPFLLALGSAAHSDVEFRHSFVGVPGWIDTLNPYFGRINAIVSSTALHYPTREVLATIYRDCARLLTERAVLVNADTFSPTDE